VMIEFGEKRLTLVEVAELPIIERGGAEPSAKPEKSQEQPLPDDGFLSGVKSEAPKQRGRKK
jgi:hypothetical protein